MEEITLHDDRPTLIQRSDVFLGRKSRYKPSFVTKELKYVLDLMEEGGLVHQELGKRAGPLQNKGEATKLSVGATLNDLAPPGLTAKDFGRLPQEETIVLKARKASRWDEGSKIDYLDTDLTKRWRSQMRDINLHLAQADIRYYDEPLATGDRHLYRVFTGGSFKEHGRLYGGFWQSLPKTERMASLALSNERVVCLDFGQMLVRTAYSHIGAQPPDGDLYNIKPWGINYREGFKKLISALLFRASPMTRKPKELGSQLPKVGLASLVWSVQQAHPLIAPLFGTGIGPQLVLVESELLVDLLPRLSECSIPALPIHDAIIVAFSDAGKAEAMMRELFASHIQVPCSIKTE